MTNVQKTTLWLGALRYYMGRMTYAVNDFCNLLIEVWPTLDEKTQALIKRDLMQEIKQDNKDREDGTSYCKRLGHDCDRAAWDRVAMLWNK